MKNVTVIIGAFILLVVISIPLYIASFFTEAATVAKQEFGPKAALEKYEWFKNQSAAIRTAETAKQSLQTNYETLVKEKESFTNVISQQLIESKISQARSDLTAYEANVKSLKEEYNSASSKFNWNFFKDGMDDNLPKKY